MKAERIVIRECENKTIGKAKMRPMIRAWAEDANGEIRHLISAECRITNNVWSVWDARVPPPKRGHPVPMEKVTGTLADVTARLSQILSERMPGVSQDLQLLPDEQDTALPQNHRR